MRIRPTRLLCAITALGLLAAAPGALAQAKTKATTGQTKKTTTKKPAASTSKTIFEIPTGKLMPAWAASKPVAEVNGVVITAGEVNTLLWEWGANNVLQTVMVFKMIDQEAKKLGITVTRKEIEKQMEESFKDLKALIPKGRTLDQELLSRGTSWSRVYVQVRATQQLDKIIERKLARKDLVLSAQIVVRVPGNTEEEQKKNRDATVEQAKKVADEIRAGTISWDEAVNKYSEDPFTKSKGGDLGWRWKEELDGQFVAAVFMLKAGEVSDPVETTMGFLIIRAVKFGEKATPEEFKAASKRIVEQKRGGVVREMQDKAKMKNYLVPIIPPSQMPGQPGGPRPGGGPPPDERD